MLEASVDIRVRYAETDKMGYVYYGNYSTYLEVARVEMLRDLGIVYKELEDEGILLPLLDFNIKYIRPGKYDDILTVKTKIVVKTKSYHHPVPWLFFALLSLPPVCFCVSKIEEDERK